MKWIKKGLIYVPDGSSDWAKTTATLPTPYLRKDGSLRVFLGFLDDFNIGRIGYVDIDPENPQVIYKISSQPVLNIGEEGAFDDNGVVPLSIIEYENKLFLYYVGFQKGVKVPYYMFCGLAISEDDGDTFYRHSKVPILDRTNNELFARCGVSVIRDENIWKMWYVGSIKEGWVYKEDKSLPLYQIKYLESRDGINWGSVEGKNCLNFKNDDEHGFGRPFVIKEGNVYKMFYSIRTLSKGYRIGYGESLDGVSWKRLDEQIGIDVSDNGWDSESICYAFLFTYQNLTYLFYNGNNMGRTGFGYATLEEKE
ncbi:hypothetical protein H1Q59_00085 [Holosporaceae bacterium 'Namur']|nr:hypothetical protein [Holosporaceae bacterium 'Namur']